MASSFSFTSTTTFTATHAKHLAAKVATDLKRMQRLYGSPSNDMIMKFEQEILELLKAGYLREVIYGFKRGGNWIEPTVRYTARELVGTSANDDPGRIRPGADIEGAVFGSYLTYSASWRDLPSDEQASFEKGLPIMRIGAAEPGVDGYFKADRSYSSGGYGLDRTSVRSGR